MSPSTDPDPDPGSSDDAAAIRRAIDVAQPGDTVALPEGTFDLRSVDPDEETTHVLLRSGVHVRGAGPGRTVLVSDFDGHDDSVVLMGEAVEDLVLAPWSATT